MESRTAKSEGQMIKVSDYIAKKLHSFGLKHVFMVTGGGAMHLNDSFVHDSPFRVIFNHHEQACAIAAEGLYRATGQVGIVNVTTGPGGLNTLTGLMGQWTDSIPTIYISGQVKYETTLMCCRNLNLRQLGDQEVDIIPVVKSLTKYAVSVVNPEDIRKELEKAWHLALSGRKGPVWLDIPMNVQGAIVDEDSLEAFIVPTKPLQPVDTSSLVELLSKSKNPVIVAGHGLRLSGSIASLYRILVKYPIPVVTTFNGFDLFPFDHPCYSGRIGTIGTRGGNFTLQNADLVIMLGTRNNIRQVSYNWENFARDATTVAVDIDPSELKKSTFKAKWNIVADLAIFMPKLEEGLSEAKIPDYSTWLTWARERNTRYPVALPEHYAEKDYINPYPFMKELTWAMDEKSIVVAGNGSACVVLFQAGIVKKGQRIFWNSGCASMGYDLPAAIGAAVGTAETVWCIAGDGSMQMNLQELATVSQNKLPIKIVYLNNGGYASIRQTQVNFFGGQYGCGTENGLGFPNIEKLADAYGLQYYTSRNIDALASDITRIKSAQGPLLWEVFLKLDYSFEPKLSSKRLPDGKMVSSPLEDMYPFLSDDEMKSNKY